MPGGPGIPSAVPFLSPYQEHAVQAEAECTSAHEAVEAKEALLLRAQKEQEVSLAPPSLAQQMECAGWTEGILSHGQSGQSRSGVEVSRPEDNCWHPGHERALSSASPGPLGLAGSLPRAPLAHHLAGPLLGHTLALLRGRWSEARSGRRRGQGNGGEHGPRGCPG